MTQTEFRDTLVKMVKACGEELIERAEDFVGATESLTYFNINIDFSIDSGRLYSFDGVPTIDVNKSHSPEKSSQVLIDFYMGGN